MRALSAVVELRFNSRIQNPLCLKEPATVSAWGNDTGIVAAAVPANVLKYFMIIIIIKFL